MDSDALATATTPDGGQLCLYERRGRYVIRVDGRELATSEASQSETELGRLASAAVAHRPAPSVLIGGLGMGFTLAATLRGLPPQAEVVVAELVPAVIEWNRERLGGLAGHPLEDGRVRVVTGDVAPVLAEAAAGYDAVVLDVDNGPWALTHSANEELYSPAGLRAIRRSLREAGIVAIWSASPDPAFAARLRETGFSVQEHCVSAQGFPDSPAHTVWVGHKGPAHV